MKEFFATTESNLGLVSYSTTVTEYCNSSSTCLELGLNSEDFDIFLKSQLEDKTSILLFFFDIILNFMNIYTYFMFFIF